MPVDVTCLAPRGPSQAGRWVWSPSWEGRLVDALCDVRESLVSRTGLDCHDVLTDGSLIYSIYTCIYYSHIFMNVILMAPPE